VVPDAATRVVRLRPEHRPGNGQGARPRLLPAVGTDVIVLDLRSKTSQFFGSVADIAFNKKGDLLAYTMVSPIKDGNDLFVSWPADEYRRWTRRRSTTASPGAKTAPRSRC
jgi:hypothetical protein